MELTPQITEKLKQTERDMFACFIDICRRLELTYYVIGGTLLGAVRHKGFIPWDDDIDVGMPRKDYEIFCQKAQKLLPEGLFLQTYRTDPEYPANFAKIRNSGTTFIETSLRNCNINHGVYIDVFPLDYYPDSRTKELVFLFLNKLYIGRISCQFYLPDYQSFKYRLWRAVGKLFCPSLTETLQARDKLFAAFNRSSRMANHCGAWGKREIVPAEWFGNGCELTFEGLTVRAPSEYGKWLTQVYGDYMQLPPPEKRKAHHFNDAVDLEKPYTVYCK